MGEKRTVGDSSKGWKGWRCGESKMTRTMWINAIVFLIFFPVFGQAKVTIGEGDLPGRHDWVGEILFASGESYRVDSDEVVAGDVYSGAGRVEVRGMITGDLFALSGETVLAGTVGKDAAIVTFQLELEGYVGDSLRAVVAESLSVSGTVDGAALVLGKTVVFRSSATMNGTVVARGGHVQLDGTFNGPVRIGAGEAILSGHFASDVFVTCDALRLEPGLVIEGNLTYASRNDVSVPEGAVAGLVKREERVEEEVGESDGWELPASVSLLVAIYLAATALIAGLFFVLFFRPFVEGALVQAGGGGQLVVAFGTGLVALLVLLFFCVFCVFFLPLWIGLWAAFMALLYFGGLIGKILIGQMILCPLMKRPPHPVLALLLGVLVMMLLALVPYLGGLVWLIVTVTGVGAAMLQIRAGRVGPAECAPLGEAEV